MEALTTRAKLAYAGLAFGLTYVQIPAFVYLPKFYSDVIGVEVAVVGTIIMLGRVLDAITDPVLGAWSDTLRTRWGRRRPLIVFASIPCAACVLALFAPPDGAGAAWLAGTLFFTTFAWTMTTIPYEALGVEITRSYDERTSLFGLRDALALLATLLAAASPVLIAAALGLGDDARSERVRFAVYAVIAAPLLIALAAACGRWVREPRLDDEAEAIAPRWRERFRGMRDNAPYRRLLLAFTVGSLGAGIPTTTILYFAQYVLGIEQTEAFLVLFIAFGVLFVPVWVAAARRYEKRSAYVVALLVMGTSQVAVAFLGPGQTWAYGTLTAISGTAFGALLVLPNAMQADVIDVGERLSGQRDEGLYIGVWSVARKLATALGIGAALLAIDLAGYEPNAVQSEAVVTVLRITYGIVPGVFTLLGAWLLLPYDVDRQMHARVRAELEAVRGEAAGPP